MKNQVKTSISDIIGRDASEVTKRNPPQFAVKIRTVKTRHIAWMGNIVRMPLRMPV